MSRFASMRSPAVQGLWLVLVSLAFFGCNKATSGGGGAHAPRVYVSDTWNDLEVKSLAYVALGSSIGNDVHERAADRIVEGELRGSQDRFILLGTTQVVSRAKKAEQVELLERVQSVWRNDRKVDQFLAVELCEVLGVDGLLFADLSDWTEDRIDPAQEGTSWSRVGLGLYIRGAERGLVIWGADRSLRVDSMPYNPPPVADDAGATEREQRSLNRNDTTPDPPEIEKVAREVLRELIDSFPPRQTS